MARDWLRPGMGFEAMEDYGLCWSRGRWLYGKPTYLAWLPSGISHFLQGVWNPVVCRLRGHEWNPDFCQADMERYFAQGGPKSGVPFQPCGREVCMYCATSRWVMPEKVTG